MSTYSIVLLLAGCSVFHPWHFADNPRVSLQAIELNQEFGAENPDPWRETACTLNLENTEATTYTDNPDATKRTPAS